MVAKKLNSNGQVDTMQTLHNLNEGICVHIVWIVHGSCRERCFGCLMVVFCVLYFYLSDELSVFEDTWRGSARKHLPGWSEGFNAHDGM